MMPEVPIDAGHALIRNIMESGIVHSCIACDSYTKPGSGQARPSRANRATRSRAKSSPA